ncbi:carbohydrate ABC transporter permease, partial [Oceanispirochaeta sp.]|uniref:carbohydrate ABC transporter permease n=1 Tax=Oceanispirochaeta sp. TaxID=2035350 RepID=UPI0026047523
MKKSSSFHRYLNRTGWTFIAPSILLYLVFMVYPITSSLLLVTQKWRGLTSEFVGLGNFVRMAQDQIFWKALSHNFLFMIVQIPLMVFLAMIIAVILHHGIRRFKGLFRTVYFLPCVTSLVAYSVLFRILLQTNGLLNNFLLTSKILSDPISWLNDPFWAKVTIILALTWRWTGYNMVFFLVGLQNIDNEIYEASEVDGASKIRQFISITLPLLIPVILFSV